MTGLSGACPHCGCMEQVELARDHLGGLVCEADYFCPGCRAHLGFFAYGAWQEGSGEKMTSEDEAAAERAARNLVHIQRELVV